MEQSDPTKRQSTCEKDCSRAEMEQEVPSVHASLQLRNGHRINRNG